MLNLGNSLVKLVTPPPAPAPAPDSPAPFADAPPDDPAPATASPPEAAAPAATPAGQAAPRSVVSVLPAESVVAAANLPEPPVDALDEAQRLALAAQARFKLEDLVSRLATPPLAPLPLRDPAPPDTDRARVVQPPGTMDKLR